MTYIALAITTILTIVSGVAYEEQKLKTEKYRQLSNALLQKRIQEKFEESPLGEYCMNKTVPDLNLF